MAEILFADITVKQRVENWADGYGWDAIQKLEGHFDCLFPNRTVVIVELAEESPPGTLLMRVESAAWEGKREFCLGEDGGLFYDGPTERGL